MGKRANGEGSVYQRKDGMWVGSVTVGLTPTGKPKRKYFYAKTQREALAKLNDAKRSLQAGLPIPDQRSRLDDYLNAWLVDTVKRRVRYSTNVSYETKVRLHILPSIGSVPLAKLTPGHIERLLNQKLEEGQSPRTVQYIHAILRMALGQAEKWGLVQRNVAKLVDPPRIRRPEVVPFTPVEAKALLAAASDERLGALLTVCVALGLRQGEALGLSWTDVDLDAKELHVRNALQRQAGEWRLVEPKSDRSRRTIPLPDVCVKALHQHRVRQSQERLIAGERWSNNWNLVFTTQYGTPLDARNVNRTYERICRKAEVPVRRFHDLRHTAATLLLVQGVAPRVVMETLGHSSYRLTMDTYSHVLPVLQRDAAAAMDGVLA